jgi:uncharacterized DUF497 family protein
MAVAFEWDHAKDLANQRKHGVAFNEASIWVVTKERTDADVDLGGIILCDSA